MVEVGEVINGVCMCMLCKLVAFVCELLCNFLKGCGKTKWWCSWCKGVGEVVVFEMLVVVGVVENGDELVVEEGVEVVEVFEMLPRCMRTCWCKVVVVDLDCVVESGVCCVMIDDELELVEFDVEELLKGWCCLCCKLVVDSLIVDVVVVVEVVVVVVEVDMVLVKKFVCCLWVKKLVELVVKKFVVWWLCVKKVVELEVVVEFVLVLVLVCWMWVKKVFVEG